MPFRVSKITKIYIQVFFKTAAQLSLQFFPQFQNFITLHTKHETHSSVKIVLIGWTWIISPKKICSLGQYNYWVFPMIAHIHNKLLKKRADVQWDKNDNIGKKIWKYKINIYYISFCRTLWGQLNFNSIFLRFWSLLSRQTILHFFLYFSPL